MFKFILSLGAVLVMAAPAAAVDLQPGDLISESRAEGAYAGPTNPTALTRFDRDTGATEIISGCSDADCNTVIGSGSSRALGGSRPLSCTGLSMMAPCGITGGGGASDAVRVLATGRVTRCSWAANGPQSAKLADRTSV